MAPNAQRIIALLERTLTDPEPTKALAILTDLRSELDELERTHVARALQAASPSRTSPGRSGSHARRPTAVIATSPPAPQRPTLAPDARAALIRARREAARHGSVSIDSTHLLLAIAEQYGIDVDEARRSFAPPTINAPVPSGYIPRCTRGSRATPARSSSITSYRPPWRTPRAAGCSTGSASPPTGSDEPGSGR